MRWRNLRYFSGALVAVAALFVALPSLLRAASAEEVKVEGETKTVQSEQLPTGVTFVTEADGIREYKLANGMKVLLVENRVAPVATVLVVYKVGSRNEAVGYTGSTHLLEHMMFKGTPTFNRDKNTQISATLQKVGADFNATTWYDRTNYFETVPSDQIELAIKLEADRMRNSLIADADRQSEMTVVRNELERGQNEPSEVLDEAVYAAAFREHPYHHPTIGWRTDVEGVPTARLKTFYDTFYHPNNSTAIIVGDFERGHTLSLINKYFGAYAASASPIPQVYTEEPPQQGERRLVIRRAGELAIVQMAFHTPGVLGQLNVLSNEDLARRALNPPAQNDIYPLVVVSNALSRGVTSRLYQALVEKQLAVNVSSNVDQHRDPGLFNVSATVRPGVEPKQVEETILNELRRVGEQGLTGAEVEKARQQILAQVAYDRDGTFNIAEQMSEAEAVADWRYYKDYAANISRVQPADVQRVARVYFTEDNRTVGHFIPKQAGQTASADGIGPGMDDNGNGPIGPVNGEMSIGPVAAGPRGLFKRGVQFYREPGLTVEPSESEVKDARASDAEMNKGERQTANRGGSDFASRNVRTQLPNGSTLLVLENHATPTIALRGSFRAGSYFEPRDKPGLARVTAEMLERGTKKRSKLEIASALESVGADIDFTTDPFTVNIIARSLSKDLPLLMQTLSEELREPAFPADELDKLKQQTIAAIQEQQASTGYRAYERFTQLTFDAANPFYLPAGQKLITSINSITVDDVRRFYTEQYGGRSLILSVAGDVSAGEVRKQFEESFGSFAGPRNVDINVPDPAQATGSRREVVLIKDKASVDIYLGAAAPLRRNAKDYYAAILANSALGESTLSSRLGLQVRDKEGLTYGINSRFRSPGLASGPWLIGVSVNPQNVEKAVNSTVNVLRDYVQKGIRPEELADEKSSAIGAFKVSLASNAGLARALWNAEFYNLGADYLDRYPQLIGAVTVEEVNAAIRKYFRPDQLTVVLAGDYQAATPGATPVK
ncbi:MAG TPA: pitrilysin family protein [Pyrinomonadaceae bacterium]|jgi:zinc protease|nr:pitrilysin family protein [Pyrinomonadaceae bacterium]